MAIGGFDSTIYENEYPVEWVDNLKLLGITFFVDITQTIKQNYTKCFSQLEKQMSTLKEETFVGRNFCGSGKM